MAALTLEQFSRIQSQNAGAIGLPAKVQFLFERHRYKGARGGRGSGKSESVARALLLLGTGQVPGWEAPLRILCARETQKSIQESVHQLLVDLIEQMGLQGHYDVRKAWIRGVNGTLFTFAGLKNVRNLKSLANYDICWIEEGESVTADSWSKLIPTFRKAGSEIWLTWNPYLPTDATHKRFVINPPKDAVIVEMNWRDNPWFPDVLRREMEELKERDFDEYLHVYEGQCLNVAKGAIYGEQFRQIEAEGRITRVPYDHTKPVHTCWDLGWADYVSIWFVQVFPFEYRVIDFVEGSRKNLNDYLKLIQSRGYVWGTDYLPHDARAHSLGTGKSIEELMRAAGRKVQVVPALKKPDQLNAVRTILPQCWFDAEKCEDGLMHLRHYKYGEQKTLGVDTREPLHDEHSHAADAFAQFAVGVRQPKTTAAKPAARRPHVSVWS